jgi:protein-tyrosine kinase
MERIRRALELARLQREQAAPLTRNSEPTVTEEPALVDLNAWRTPIAESDPQLRERERILDPDATGSVAGAYKMLRTQVLRRLDKLGARTLAIISAREQDGKTVTAINLAISIATDPARTSLLVDLDLRHPGVHQKLGMQVRQGVEESLRGDSAIETALVRPSGFQRLTVLPALARVENSSELLAGRRTGALVEELKMRYANRVVLFDLPPVLQSDDALAFSQHVDAALLVVGEGRTAREDVIRTIELFKDTPIVGTVLNASRENTGTHY